MPVGLHEDDRAGLPLPVVLAALLAASGIPMVVIGGTARRLLGVAVVPRDLDIVLADGPEPLAAVGAVLTRLAGGSSGPPRCRSWTVDTSLGRLDVVDTVSAPDLPAARDVLVLDVAVPVAVRP